MKKLLGAMFLTGAAVLVVAGVPDTLAQGKKPGKTGTIELVESKDGKYRFTIRDAEGTYLGGSTVGQATEKEARAACEELKKVLATATYVSKKSEETKKEKAKDKE